MRYSLNFAAWPLLLMGLFACAGPHTRYLTDSQGREIVLHGLNISNEAKREPNGVAWHTEADYARMGEWGFNCVRMLFFWDRVEPSPNSYDQAYLDRMDKLLSTRGVGRLRPFLEGSRFARSLRKLTCRSRPPIC